MAKFKYEPEYRIEINGKPLLIDKNKFNLLKYVQEYGSITRASQKSNIPYRSALKYIENLENQLNDPIVISKRGGKGGGGGSQLTKTGLFILIEYRKVESVIDMHSEVNEIQCEIATIDLEKKIMIIYLGKEKVILPLRGDFCVGEKVLILISPDDIIITLEPQKSSVRNVFKGRITHMEVKDEIVRLNIDIGEIDLFADVTQYARDDLQLDIGKEVFMGFKAAAIPVIKL
ncbi:MAG: TOBE domain-containing protein [Methanobacteriaceae archaeon]|nr:TOBE domain-containing protein [Methanobacteriaceae archaeon]